MLYLYQSQELTLQADLRQHSTNNERVKKVQNRKKQFATDEKQLAGSQSVNTLTTNDGDEKELTSDDFTRLMKYAREVRLAPTLAAKNKHGVPFALIDIPEGTKINHSQLITLTETPLPDMEVAVRPLDKANVESIRIAYENNEDLPALKLAGSTWGTIIIGGLHRFTALQEMIEAKFGVKPGEKPTDEQLKKINMRRGTTPIKYTAINGKTPHELRELAVLDNVTHGKGASLEQRSQYALILISEAKQAKRKANVSAICRMLHISRQAVYQQDDRNVAAATKADKTYVSPLKDSTVLTSEDIAEREKFEAQQVKKQADKPDPTKAAATRIINAMVALNKEYNATLPGDKPATAMEYALFFKQFIDSQEKYNAIQTIAAGMVAVEWKPTPATPATTTVTTTGK